MSKHNWVVTKEYTERCSCPHDSCQVLIVRSRDHFCKSCGQKTWTSRGDDPNNHPSYGFRPEECEQRIALILDSIINSKELQDKVQALLRSMNDDTVNWDRGKL